jgi:NAD-dependent deacetylase
VDGLHHAAGSRNVIDIHGDVLDTLCLSCGRQGRIERETLAALQRAPRCVECAGVLRPHVVLFGEMLPPEKLRRIHDDFYRDVPDLVLVVGTSGLFAYIVEPVHVAVAAGRLTVEINPEPTTTSSIVDFSLLGEADVYVPLIERTLAASREADA